MVAILRFVGVGSAFAGPELGQSNMVIEAESGKLLLIDCGQRSQDMLQDQYGTEDDPSAILAIDAVYLTHQHADHIGGLEWLALCTYFNPTLKRPTLYCIEDLMHEIWDHSLRGGLSTIQGSEATLTTFFDCQPLRINSHFVWEGVRLTPVQTVHIVSGYRILHCYGLMIEQNAPVAEHERRVAEAHKDLKEKNREGDFIPRISATQTYLKAALEDHAWKRIFLSGDTQFAPEQLQDFYKQADLIFHDCETTPFRSRVHAHYDDLKTLPADVKARMNLYHYNVVQDQAQAREDGFAGFVEKGDTFEI